MAETSSIEWTDATWNPITGCSVVSPGCKRCYAMKLAGGRLKNHETRRGLTIDTPAGPVWTGEVRLNKQWLDQPLRWSRSRRIFVCAHGDLFHENVPDEWIDRVFAVMALAPKHTFQVLTKRADRMRAYFDALPQSRWIRWMEDFAWEHPRPEIVHPVSRGVLLETRDQALRNVWLGVSGENQHWLVQRAMHLVETPAAIRFLSYEPALGPIDAEPFLLPVSAWSNGWMNQYPLHYPKHRLDWVICGGESGPDARPMHPAWARSLRDQCAAAGVPFFFKQHGAWVPLADNDGGHWPTDAEHFCRLSEDGRPTDDGWPMQRVGKGVAGRELDGVTHDAMPEPRS